MAGKMLKWSLELSEFDIQHESMNPLKAQALADFVAEITAHDSPIGKKYKWTISVDEASSSTGSGAGILLENEEGVMIEHSLTLYFPTSNNQAEYKALIAGLRMAEDLGAREIQIFTDSYLIASQVQGGYQDKNNNLIEYLNLVREYMKNFD